MEEEFWLKYGFKENGDLTCIRTISNSKPDKKFFYTVDGNHKEAKETNVIKITKEVIEKICESKKGFENGI
jgi:myo-inositol-hexaphosphate 3-phosphohydrolase